MRNNKFIHNSNNNNSVAHKYYNKLQLEEPNILNHSIKRIEKNQPLESEALNEILQIDQQTLKLNREMMKYDHSNLIKYNLNNKSLLFTQFYQFLEMYDRDQHHSITEHNQEVRAMINNLVDSIYEQIKITNPEITSYPPQLKFFKNYLLKTYNLLEFGRMNQIKENSAMILSDPERPTSVDPVIVDHEHIAKLYFAYKFGIKAINCFQGRGSPDLLVSTRDLKKLGLIDSVEKGYLYADFKTGSFESLGYDQKKGDHKIFKFLDLIERYPKVDLFIIDIHPYTSNINQTNVEQYEKFLNYLKQCKEKLKESEDNLIKDKKVLFFDSNIPKIDINDYYNQLAELNEIDPEVFDLFKELIEGYIDYLEKSKNNVNNIDHIRNQSINDSDLSNSYIKNDVGIYLPKNRLYSPENKIDHLNLNDINNSIAKNVALTLKYRDVTHLTDEELDDFFSE